MDDKSSILGDHYIETRVASGLGIYILERAAFKLANREVKYSPSRNLTNTNAEFDYF